MEESNWLAEQFEEHRTHLRAVAQRMLGSPTEADDAVQEAWIRLDRSDTASIENLGGWLTTVVSRVCLDMLRSRTSRREGPLDDDFHHAVPSSDLGIDPEQEAVLADAVGQAMLVVLDRLAPAERVAFVLHDMFAVPFDEIAPIVGRTPQATRQLASRARRRVGGRATTEGGLARQRRVVDAFLTAARNGDFEGLLALLDPDVVLRSDEAAVRLSAAARARGGPELQPTIRGATSVARTFSGLASAARPALVAGVIGAAWLAGGRPRSTFTFTVQDGKIVAIDLCADVQRIEQLDVVVL